MQRIYDVLHNMAGNNANENNIPQPIGEAPDAEQVAQEERRANAALAIQRRMEAQEAIRVMEAQNHARRNAIHPTRTNVGQTTGQDLESLRYQYPA